MPRYIDYAEFTQTGDFPVAPIQPYEYVPIYGGISDLLISDGIITFTGMPNGLMINPPEESTSPFDQVFLDLDGVDDFITLSGNGNNWSGASLPNTSDIQCSYTSGGFWAMGWNTREGPYYIINTGSGNANSSILDIQFVQPESTLIEPTTFDPGEVSPINLIPGAFYGFNGDSSNITVPIQFNQTRNASWYIAQVTRAGASSYGTLSVSGVAFTGGAYQTVTIPSKSAGVQQLYNIKWLNGQLTLTSGTGQMTPDPFANFTYSNGYSWNSTIPNEIMSSYTVLSSNDGNSGTASIQINNAQQFSDLVVPLRKMHVLFSTGAV
jgi:hypothetical protein